MTRSPPRAPAPGSSPIDRFRPDHDRVAGVYDLLGEVWTGGAIRRGTRWAAELARPGERVLVAGAGTGRDAAAAAALGARVTAVDLSARMVARGRRRAPEVRWCRGDALARDDGPYDLVLAPYFLNVFGPDAMPGALARLAGLVGPGGRLAIADFAPGGGPARALHYGLPLAVFAALGLCGRHPIYDYAPELDALGFAVERREFAVFGLGPRRHAVWVGTRR